jgi:hypothetical protein
VPCGGVDARVSWGGSSTSAYTRRTASDASRTGELALHHRGISHALTSCMRSIPNTERLTEGESPSFTNNFNRISLPFPNL